MDEERKGPPVWLAVLVFGGGALCLIWGLMTLSLTRPRPPSGAASPGQESGGPFAKHALPPAQGRPPQTPTQEARPAGSSLDLAPQMYGDAEGGARTAPGHGDFVQKTAPAGSAQTAARADADKLTPQEEGYLKGLLGGWDEKTAFAVGNKQGLLFKLGEKVMRYPRIVGFLLNNKYVVAGFMKTERVQKNCKDPKALTQYLSDTKDPTGIGLGLQAIRSSLNTPGSAAAIFGSRLTQTVLDSCPSIGSFTKDPMAVMQVASSNPEILSVMSNPGLVSALATAPAAMQTLNDAQSALSPGPAR